MNFKAFYLLALLFPIISYAQPVDEKTLINQAIEEYQKQDQDTVYHVTNISIQNNEALFNVAGKDRDDLQGCLKKTDGKWAVFNLGSSYGPGGCLQHFGIGDVGPAEGIVFYLSDDTGSHGLEAARVNQTVGIQWGCNGTAMGETGTAVGTGMANTTAIIAKCGAGTAAQIAANYSLNGNTGWYLPSKDELNLLYAKRDVVGGFHGLYWSSTEDDSNNAWLQTFVNGNQDHLTKINTLAVRAVRAF